MADVSHRCESGFLLHVHHRSMIGVSITGSPHSRSFHAAVFALLLGSACGGEDGSPYTQGPRNTDRRAVEEPPPCPAFNARYRDQFKACQVDEDCGSLPVKVTCAGSLKVYGVAVEDADAFEECLPEFPPLNCNLPLEAPRAEDGRVSSDDDLLDIAAHCVENKCQARIDERPCGKTGLVCTDGQLCVALQNTDGAIEYDCATNPCSGSELDCQCAESVCQMRTDAERMCAIDRVTDSDVYCKTVRR